MEDISGPNPGLWCVLELFTFVHMGGKTYDINCVSLALAPDDWQNIQIQCALKQFDTLQLNLGGM